ncbi:hypothetical protein MMPV_007034 [Pyropia vietnamensis]
MDTAAFLPLSPLFTGAPALRPPLGLARTAPRRPSLAPRWCFGVTMQLPPASAFQPPLAEELQPPKGYTWDPNFPGTLKPGMVPDNFPIQSVLESGVFENMAFRELDEDERDGDMTPLSDDLLEFLAVNGRLLDEATEAETADGNVVSRLPGEELDFGGDEEDKVLQLYSRSASAAVVVADAADPYSMEHSESAPYV